MNFLKKKKDLFHSASQVNVSGFNNDKKDTNIEEEMLTGNYQSNIKVDEINWLGELNKEIKQSNKQSHIKRII